MTIAFHLTGENRKTLVKAISEVIGIQAVYQFMPTCSYKIGECYTVTKEGTLKSAILLISRKQNTSWKN